MDKETLRTVRRENLKRLIDERFAGRQADLAMAAKKNPTQINHWVSGHRNPNGDTCREVEKELGLPENWLDQDKTALALVGQLAAYGAQPVAVFDEGDVLSDDYIQIKEYGIRFSAGNGRTPVFDELTDSVAATFRREWFHRMGVNPARAIRVKVHGNSMYPLLHDGDSVVVNLAETNIINDKVYALRYGDELRIKRLYRKLDGSLILHSDNQDFIPRDEEVPPSVVESSISIVGRVRDKSGAGGL